MNYDVETALEDAIVALLKECTDTKVVRWEDISEVHLAPSNKFTDVIKVMVTLEEEELGTFNRFAGMSCLVDVVAYTSKRKDTRSRKANKERGLIRSVFAQDDIVTQLNAIGDLYVYDTGVIVTGSIDDSDEKNNGKGISLRIVVHPK